MNALWFCWTWTRSPRHFVAMRQNLKATVAMCSNKLLERFIMLNSLCRFLFLPPACVAVQTIVVCWPKCSPVCIFGLCNFVSVSPWCHISVAVQLKDKAKNATAHLLKQIYSHIHTHTQSEGLCGVTKATETQELIIVIAVDSGIQTPAHVHGPAHRAALNKIPCPCGFCVNGNHA